MQCIVLSNLALNAMFWIISRTMFVTCGVTNVITQTSCFGRHSLTVSATRFAAHAQWRSKNRLHKATVHTLPPINVRGSTSGTSLLPATALGLGLTFQPSRGNFPVRQIQIQLFVRAATKAGYSTDPTVTVLATLAA
ncbi:hypothetical protein P171DRAFT_217018 [Karstenula rhodostoma CBS 690.94]|uniref:Secreted protein n=1 Tax=Karstenula rhodostoma CBS 690.94 TaxID=1392251 RepID=A0A9P4PP01_9PLEO|nr:hypothetical protein P171DRAFT_217018 [Karstenula rhodostoma CBS 690.94]